MASLTFGLFFTLCFNIVVELQVFGLFPLSDVYF